MYLKQEPHRKLLKLIFWELKSIRTAILQKALAAKSNSNCNRKQLVRGVLRKKFLKICSKFKGKHPCRSAISKKFGVIS